MNKDHNVVIGVIYRPPDTNINSFIGHVSEILSKIKSDKKLLYIMGDFNINLLNTDKHNATQEFVDNLFSYTLLPAITKPTRVTSHSATLIDNIFCNDIITNNNVLTGILYTDITDHFPIFYIDYASKTNLYYEVQLKRTKG